jgi:hypothetical protein
MFQNTLNSMNSQQQPIEGLLISRVLWVSFALLILLLIVFRFYVGPGLRKRMPKALADQKLTIDERLSYTPQEAVALVRSYTDEARKFYRSTELTVDTLFPLTYGLFSALTVTYVIQESFAGSSWLWLLAAPGLAAMLFDFAENVCVVSMLSRPTEEIRGLARAASVLTFVKWRLGFVAFAIVVAMWLVHWALALRTEAT